MLKGIAYGCFGVGVFLMGGFAGYCLGYSSGLPKEIREGDINNDGRADIVVSMKKEFVLFVRNENGELVRLDLTQRGGGGWIEREADVKKDRIEREAMVAESNSRALFR